MGRVGLLSKDDKRVLFFVSLVWGADMLYYLKAVVLRLPIVNTLADFFVPSVIIVSILVTLRSLSKRIRTSDLLFYIVCVFLYLFTFVIFPVNGPWLELYLPIVFFQVLPFFFVGILIEPHQHIRILEYVSMLYIILSIIYLFFFASREFEGEEMGAAYSLLPHLLIVLNSCFRKFKWYSLAIFVLGLLRLMGTGNRGTLVCVAFYVIFYLVFCAKFKYRIPVIISLAILATFVALRQDVVFGFLSDFLGGLGFNTRAIDMVLDNEFTNANGRDELMVFFSEKIRSGGVLGYGVLGDRALLNADNGYPHNLAIELLVDFGVPLGTAIIIAISVLLIRAFKCTQDQESKSILIVFVTAGVFSLFLSHSYLTYPMFFLTIGYCIRTIRNSIPVDGANTRYNLP